MVAEINYVGLGLGLLAAMGQAIGAVLSRAALANTGVDPLWSTLLRLVAGLVLMIGVLRWQGPLGNHIRPLKSWKILGGLVLGAFMGTYLALYLPAKPP